MIGDDTIAALTANMTKENIRAVFTELSSYKQKSANLERALEFAEARLNEQERLMGQSDQQDARDPKGKPMIINDFRIVVDEYGHLSIRNMDGSLPDHELQGRFTGIERLRDHMDNYLIKKATENATAKGI